MTTSTTARAESSQATPSVISLRTVGLKTLRDERHSIIWWSAGSALLSAIVIMLYPSIDAPQLEELFERLPAPMRAMIGEEFDISTVGGYLDLRLFTFITPVIVLVYAIGRGAAATAGEETRGTMDLLLSLPVQRWRIVVEKAIAMLVGLLIIGFGVWAGLVAGGLFVGVALDMNRALQATLMGVLLGTFHGMLAMTIGGATGKTGLATGVSAATGVAGYFLHTLAPLVSWLDPYKVLSPFYYYISDSAMLGGINTGHAAVLITLSILLVAAAVVAFNQRDVQT